jgi:TPR repeat protein
MINLGYVYESGYGTTWSYRDAIAWYRKAADAGSPLGMYHVGVLYETGGDNLSSTFELGARKDRQQAISWYRKAAQLGEQCAKDALNRLGESSW